MMKDIPVNHVTNDSAMPKAPNCTKLFATFAGIHTFAASV